MVFNIIAAIVMAYLLGSVPFAYIITRAKKGADIRRLGGGNAGALNVYREVGPAYGLAVLAGDVAKGTLAVYIARWLGLSPLWVCVAGFAAVAGHNWPAFIGFRGGKGGATVMGVLIPLVPVEFAIGFVIAVLIVITTSNVRLGVIGLALIPLFAWLFEEPLLLIYFPLALVLFLIARTLSGIKGELAKSGDRKGVIFDRSFHFWQTKKK